MTDDEYGNLALEVDWRDVLGFENLYKVSSLGEIVALARKVDRFPKSRNRPYSAFYEETKVRPANNGTGYLIVGLSGHGVRKMRTVHTIVLEAFIGPRPRGYQACHCDGNKENNSIANLRWDTISANHLDKRKHGTSLIGEKNHSTKYTIIQVREVKALLAEGTKPTIIAKATGVSRKSVCHIRDGRSWTHVL